MKKFILGLIIGISVSVIAADVTISIIIPSNYVTEVIAAFEYFQSCDMRIEAKKN